jgi:hypothetical protein
MLDGSIRSRGLPVYTMDGAVVGVLTTLESGVREGSDEYFGMMSTGGYPFVLPGKVVAGLIRQARNLASEATAAEVGEGYRDGNR